MQILEGLLLCALRLAQLLNQVLFYVLELPHLILRLVYFSFLHFLGKTVLVRYLILNLHFVQLLVGLELLLMVLDTLDLISLPCHLHLAIS